MPCFDAYDDNQELDDIRRVFDLNESEAAALIAAGEFRDALFRLHQSGQCCADCQDVTAFTLTVLADFIDFGRNQWKQNGQAKQRLRLVERQIGWMFVGDTIPNALGRPFPSLSQALGAAQKLGILVRDKDGHPFGKGTEHEADTD